MKYRPEIDGLRALAVVPVILFHAGFTAFPGGFVGVDVFFVISGYLITSLIVLEHQNGRFSLRNFYDRRIRRIIPALFFICMACVPAAIMMFPNSQLTGFARALVATFLFASNILFWRKVDYFNHETETNPLIHTWSLAVEEQFYMLFPLFVMFTWKYGIRNIFRIVFACLVASLVVAELTSSLAPQAAFYLLPSRAWELLAGSMAAIYLIRRGTPASRFNDPLAGLGILLICGSVLAYSKSTPFPGIYAIVPTLGSVLVILFAVPSTLSARLLASRPFVGIGLISYSAYLWHQSLFAFYRVQTWLEVTPAGFAAAIILTLLLAYLTWRYVERPFRRHDTQPRLPPIPAAAAASAFAVAAGALVWVNAATLSSWGMNQRQIAILAYTGDESRSRYRTLYLHGRCFLREDQRFADVSPSCFSKIDAQQEVVLWGDSHAASLYPALKPMLAERMTFLTGGGCTPVVGLTSLRKSCQDLHDGVMQYVAGRSPGRVILPGRWAEVADRPHFKERFAATLEALLRAGVKDIVVLGPLPEWAPSNPELLAKQMGGPEAPELEQNQLYFMNSSQLKRIEKVDALLAGIALEAMRLARDGQNIRVETTAGRLCDDRKCVGGIAAAGQVVPISWDYGHLTREGAEFLLTRLPPLGK